MSLEIEKLDKNFLPSAELTKRFPNIKLYDAKDCSAEITGVYFSEEEGFYRRIPLDVSSINPSINALSKHTSGGRVRFRTNSPFIALRAKKQHSVYMSHMPLTGSSGCEIYINSGKDMRFLKSCRASSFNELWFEDGCSLEIQGFTDKDGYKNITIAMPLYGGLSDIYIGIDENSELLPPLPHKHGKVVFYGSSITQGGCASRAGSSYDGMIEKFYDCEIYNLGFSGNAKGEPEMAEYIADLHPEIFVYDYDHNTPTLEHLKATHKPFFDIVRAKNPDMPVIFMSAPTKDLGNEEFFNRRRDIIFDTYKKALEQGDKNVYFIDGGTIFPQDIREFCTVDGCHPNDLGFMCMAKKVGAVLEEIWSK